MKANRIILCLKDDNMVRQYTAKNFHMDSKGIYFINMHDEKMYNVPLDQIDRLDVFHINVDPITFEPVISSSNESA